ncbi:MAG: arsenic efflux protein [Eubacterium sp.]|nr:arsenic efflux protein [Eubacterium sp.]
MLMDILLDGLLDSLKLIPFLFLTYLTMEYLEHKTSTKTRAVVRKAGRLGPLAGSIAGVFPQCGFSAAASNLYAGGVITTGTLIAVFLSTSDEMLPIFVSESVPVRSIVIVLGIKLVLGMITGFLVDFIFRFRPSPIRYKEIHSMCESEHCGCEEGIFSSALKHTVKIFLFVFLCSIVLGLLIELGGEARLAQFLSGCPVLGPLLAGIVGLIPNCASSVVITQLFLGGMISFGTMMSGLLVGAGVGLLILFRANKRWKENLSILCILYVSGVVWGIVLDIIWRFYSL